MKVQKRPSLVKYPLQNRSMSCSLYFTSGHLRRPAFECGVAKGISIGLFIAQPIADLNSTAQPSTR